MKAPKAKVRAGKAQKAAAAIAEAPSPAPTPPSPPAVPAAPLDIEKLHQLAAQLEKMLDKAAATKGESIAVDLGQGRIAELPIPHSDRKRAIEDMEAVATYAENWLAQAMTALATEQYTLRNVDAAEADDAMAPKILDLRKFHASIIEAERAFDRGQEAAESGNRESIMLELDGVRSERWVKGAAIYEAFSTITDWAEASIAHIATASVRLGVAAPKFPRKRAAASSSPVAGKLTQNQPMTRQLQHGEPLPLLFFLERLHRLGSDIATLMEEGDEAKVIIEGRVLESGDAVVLKELAGKLDECEQSVLEMFGPAMGTYLADEWTTKADATPIFPATGAPSTAR